MLLLALLGCTPTVTPDLDRPPVVSDAERGMCVATLLDRWNTDHLDVQAETLRALGARTVRQDIRWSYVQPTEETWDWTMEDAVVEGATDAGVEVIAMLGYGVPWATSVEGADTFYPPDDPADFATFAAAATERYGDRVSRWEIWNEPNAGYRFWKQEPWALGGDPAAYAELFVAAAEAIHAVDPAAEVQLGGTFFHDIGIPGTVDFLEGALAARPDLLDHADAVAFHPYTLYPPRVPPEEGAEDEIPLVEMIAMVRDVTGDLPVVITEVGWPDLLGVTDEEQGDWLLRAFALSQAEGVRDFCWYTLEDDESPESNPEDAFGLYDRGPGDRKPAGDAFAVLAEAITGMDVVGRVEEDLALPDGVYAVRWAAEDAATTLIWTVEGEVPVQIPSIGCTASAAWGGPVEDGRRLGLTARPTPTLLVEGC